MTSHALLLNLPAATRPMAESEQLNWDAVQQWLDELDSSEEGKTRAELLRKMMTEISRLNSEVLHLECQLLSYKWDMPRG